MNPNIEIGTVVNLIINDMLLLEPDCNLHLHVVDSLDSGIPIVGKLFNDEPTIIGVPSAVVRHKLAFNLELPIETFSFIRENKSDLQKVMSANTRLILWDYLNLSQPIASQIVLQGWKQVDLIVILRNMINMNGEQNFSLYNLIMPGNPAENGAPIGHQ